MCESDVKDLCTVGDAPPNCCKGISVCSVWGTTDTLRCNVPNPTDMSSTATLYANGEMCVAHLQCQSSYCDKKGETRTPLPRPMLFTFLSALLY